MYDFVLPPDDRMTDKVMTKTDYVTSLPVKCLFICLTILSITKLITALNSRMGNINLEGC
jgi:hypothetical protein